MRRAPSRAAFVRAGALGRTLRPSAAGAAPGRARARLAGFGVLTVLALLALLALLAPLGCRSRMAKIDGVRDALLTGEDDAALRRATDGVPACKDTTPIALGPKEPSPRDTGCLADIADALGSKHGFSVSPPDQASAAAAAVVVARDGRGDLLAHADAWLGSMKAGSGAGVDALRLAVAHAMKRAAPLVGRRIDEDAAALATMKALAAALPGACPTYQMLGSGIDPKTIPAELDADHSACVQHDLQRREGPGGRYGAGTFRALEGSLALWRETERALRLGLGKCAPATRAAIEKDLAEIEPATQKNATKHLAADATRATTDFLGGLHAEAGIALFGDAGADAGADAGPDGGATGGATGGGPAPPRLRMPAHAPAPARAPASAPASAPDQRGRSAK
jgi:hypothetical protein